MTLRDPQLSVIVPCFRATRWLPLQLEALSKQVGAIDFEIVLVDNGENSGLDELVQTWIGVLPRLKIVDATDRRGAGYARNRGIGEAKADLLMFCDADDVVMPDWITTGFEELQKRAVFSGGAVSIVESICDEGWEAVVRHLGPAPRPTDPLPRSGTDTYPILMGGSFGIRKHLARQLGGFDLSFGSAAEDNDLANRIVAAGHDLVDASHVRIAYRHRQQSATWRQGFRNGFNQARLCQRHDLWHASGAYRGWWVLRPVRSAGAALLAWMQGHQDPGWREGLGRQVGVIAGWLRYRPGMGIPLPELGVGIQPVPHH